MMTNKHTGFDHAQSILGVAVKPISGAHCGMRFPYHFVCPACSARFCPICYTSTNIPLGAAHCPNCRQVVYFATREPEATSGN